MTKNWTIQAGEPFPRSLSGGPQRIRVTLPTGRDWWLTADEVEVHCQIREDQRATSGLLYDLAECLELSVVGDDVIIDWSMTGQQTREMPAKTGAYDMILSDAGEVDARAIIVLAGKISVRPVVSAATTAP